MLTSISIQGFKSLRDVQVELGQVNVFIGANGSGKTNLLEAIGLLSAAADGKIDDQALMRRGVRIGLPNLYRSSFQSGGLAERVVVQAKGKGTSYEIEIPFVSSVREEPLPYTTGSKADEAILKRLRDYAIFAPTTPVLRGLEPDRGQRVPVGLAGGQLAEAVGDILDTGQGTLGAVELDEMLELLDWVESVDTVSPSREIVSPSVPVTRTVIRFTDRWMKQHNNRLSAYDASEGALYVLFALVLALHPQAPALFAIENLYQTMHPRLARATTRLFCRLVLQAVPPRQALLTTHNPLVLDGLNLRDERIRLFAVERGSNGPTQVHRVQVSEEVLEATQEGLTLSNLWVMGRLGGAPDIF